MSRLSRMVIAGLILASIIFLASHQLTENQFSPTSDEGYYYRYASYISEKGPAGFKDLIAWYAGSDEARKHPAPMRIGYISFLALLFKISGPHYVTLGTFSLICFVAFLGLFYFFCRRHFDTDTALLSTLLLSSSPLLMAMSRRALADSAVNLMWGLCVWIFLEFLVYRKYAVYWISLFIFSLAILVKESSLVLLPFFLIALVIFDKKEGNKLSLSYACGIVIWPILISILLLVIFLGGIETFMSAVQAIGLTHFGKYDANLYSLYCMGPWYRYIVDFLLMSPITTLLFIGYSFYILASKKLERKTAYFLLYFTITYGILNSFGHTKVVRFAVNLEMVMALFSVLALYELFRHPNIPTSHKRILSIVTIIYFINIFGFIDVFYNTGLLDPISYHLLRLRHFMPMFQ